MSRIYDTIVSKCFNDITKKTSIITRVVSMIQYNLKSSGSESNWAAGFGLTHGGVGGDVLEVPGGWVGGR